MEWCSAAENDDWFTKKPRHYHKRKISTALKDHFKIDSIVRHKNVDGKSITSCKYRHEGDDFETFLAGLGEGYSGDE